jgi:hypothetical protein
MIRFIRFDSFRFIISSYRSQSIQVVLVLVLVLLLMWSSLRQYQTSLLPQLQTAATHYSRTA